MNWLNVTISPLLNKIISSGILLLIVFALRMIVVRRLVKREGLTPTIRRRWIIATRNAAFFLVLAGLVFVWFEQLRTLAATAVVVAAAIVIATKELLLNVTGFIFRSGTHFFSIGDRIEIDEMRGDVIDQSLMGVTILEIGPGNKSHQYTGRAVFIPNSVFLSSPVNSETFMEDYVFHLINIPLKADSDWQQAEEALLKAANEVCTRYIDESRRHMRHLSTRHSLDAPRVEPKVHIQIPEPEVINLVLRVPTPALRRGRTEQSILRRYLLNLKNLSPSENVVKGSGTAA